MDIRPSSIAGTWYPRAPERLRQDLDRYLAAAQVAVPAGPIRGCLVPHAGLPYSGPVAAWAYACLRGLRPDLVAVVGPMHYPARAPLLTTAHAAYATPLGAVPVDIAALRRLDRELRALLGAGMARVRDDREHAIEIELPFLQRVLGDFRLLPVMVRDQRPAAAEALGHALAAALRGRSALLIASSDLSHYHPQPVAHDLDRELLRRVAEFDPAGVLASHATGAGSACGAGVIAAVLWAARGLGADRVAVLRYATSGDVTGDYDAVVGYGASIIWQSPPSVS